MNTDLYTCDFCGFTDDWENSDERHGDLWSCEECGRIFCSKCFKDKHGQEQYYKMVQSEDHIKCPECFKK